MLELSFPAGNIAKDGQALTGAGAAAVLPPPAFAFAASRSASLSAMYAIGEPTFATPPSSMTMAPRMPLSKLSTSMSALSDSTTTCRA